MRSLEVLMSSALAAFLILFALEEKKEPQIDEIELRCSPPLGLSGYKAYMHFRIEKPKKFYCPTVTIFWPGDFKSGPRGADCDPLPEGEIGEPWSSADLWPAGIWFQVPPGKHEIKVEFETSEAFARKSCFVEASE